MKAAVVTGLVAGMAGVIAGAAVASAYLLKMNEVGAVLLTGLGAVVVSTVATSVSIYTLINESTSGRIGATLNYMISRQTDRDEGFRRAEFIRLSREPDGLARYASNERETSDEFRVISETLNIIEFAALAIEAGSFDFKLYKKWNAFTVLSTWRAAMPFVFAVRARTGVPSLWAETEHLVRRMEGRRGKRP